jgi:hypothetical protein
VVVLQQLTNDVSSSCQRCHLLSVGAAVCTAAAAAAPLCWQCLLQLV